MPSRQSSETTLDPAVEYPALSSQVSHWQLLRGKGVVTPEILRQEYDGTGTESDPYIVTFIENDPVDPKTLSKTRKWMVVAAVSFVSLVASLGSSIYVGTINEIVTYFRVSNEVALVGFSTYVLGLGTGPLIWAPLGELYGRQPVYLVSFGGFTLFNLGTTVSQNIQTVIILRFFAGVFASSPLTNASGILADMFEPAERGLAFGIYATSPFMGPLLGPVIGGFLGVAAGFRWVFGLLTIVSGFCWIAGGVLMHETFGAVLLRRRSNALSKLTGRHYLSNIDLKAGPVSAQAVFRKAMVRPWALLFLEPIIFSLSTYVSLIYGTLYLFLAGFPYIYERARGWSAGVSGLALFGILVGTIIAAVVNVPVSKHFARRIRTDGANSSPEVRLQPAMVGAVALPVGLFWFAWTNGPSIPWPVSVIASSLFGFGIVIVWTSVNNYIVDAYKVYAASALAGQVVWRSLFGAIFPLFTGYMYQGIGLHWATMVPALISLVCAPLPFVFYKYGPRIRSYSKYAAKADEADTALREKKGSV